MTDDFGAQYAQLDDEQLLEVARDRSNLAPQAGLALDAEIQKRGLTGDDLAEHSRFVKRSYERERRIWHLKAYGPKARRNKLLYVLAVVLALSALIVFLTR